MAVVLYQVDRMYDIKHVMHGACQSIREASRKWSTSNDPNAFVDQEWIVGLAMIILSLVIASKRVVLRGVKSPFLVDEDY